MVEDLKVLRSLFSYLVNYDAVTFFLYLETIKEANKLARSTGFTNLNSWLLLDAANVVFECGRQRVFERKSSNTVETKIDIPPKWKVLTQILKEIEGDRASREKSSAGNGTSS